MPLLEQVRKELTESMKARDAERTQALRMLVAELQKEASSSKPSEDLAVIRRLISQREEAEAAFRNAGSVEKADAEASQAKVYREYLPAQPSDEELKGLVEEAVTEAGADSPKQMGQVMKLLQPRVAGRAENARMAEAVKCRLTGGA